MLFLLERCSGSPSVAGAPGPGGIWTGIAFAGLPACASTSGGQRRRSTLREELRPGESILITHTTQPRG